MCRTMPLPHDAFIFTFRIQYALWPERSISMKIYSAKCIKQMQWIIETAFLYSSIKPRAHDNHKCQGIYGALNVQHTFFKCGNIMRNKLSWILKLHNCPYFCLAQKLCYIPSDKCSHAANTYVAKPRIYGHIYWRWPEATTFWQIYISDARKWFIAFWWLKLELRREAGIWR